MSKFLTRSFIFILVLFSLAYAEKPVKAHHYDIACAAEGAADALNAIAGINPGDRSKIKLLSPTFNTSEPHFIDMVSQVKAFAGGSWGQLEAASMTAYNTPWGPSPSQPNARVTTWINHARGAGAHVDGKVFVTETGFYEYIIRDVPDRQTAINNLAEQINLVKQDPNVLGAALFNGFGDSFSSDFADYHLSAGEMNQICGPSCGPNIGVNTTVYGDSISQNHYDRANTHDSKNMVFITTSNAEQMGQTIRNALNAGETPVVRIGVLLNSGFPGETQDEILDNITDFIRDLNNEIPDGQFIYLIAGPNEPDIEGWADPDYPGSCGGRIGDLPEGNIPGPTDENGNLPDPTASLPPTVKLEGYVYSSDVVEKDITDNEGATTISTKAITTNTAVNGAVVKIYELIHGGSLVNGQQNWTTTDPEDIKTLIPLGEEKTCAITGRSAINASETERLDCEDDSGDRDCQGITCQGKYEIEIDNTRLQKPFYYVAFFCNNQLKDLYQVDAYLDTTLNIPLDCPNDPTPYLPPTQMNPVQAGSLTCENTAAKPITWGSVSPPMFTKLNQYRPQSDQMWDDPSKIGTTWYHPLSGREAESDIPADFFVEYSGADMVSRGAVKPAMEQNAVPIMIQRIIGTPFGYLEPQTQPERGAYSPEVPIPNCEVLKQSNQTLAKKGDLEQKNSKTTSGPATALSTIYDVKERYYDELTNAQKLMPACKIEETQEVIPINEIKPPWVKDPINPDTGQPYKLDSEYYWSGFYIPGREVRTGVVGPDKVGINSRWYTDSYKSSIDIPRDKKFDEDTAGFGHFSDQVQSKEPGYLHFNYQVLENLMFGEKSVMNVLNPPYLLKDDELTDDVLTYDAVERRIIKIGIQRYICACTKEDIKTGDNKCDEPNGNFIATKADETQRPFVTASKYLAPGNANVLEILLGAFFDRLLELGGATNNEPDTEFGKCPEFYGIPIPGAPCNLVEVKSKFVVNETNAIDHFGGECLPYKHEIVTDCNPLDPVPSGYFSCEFEEVMCPEGAQNCDPNNPNHCSTWGCTYDAILLEADYACEGKAISRTGVTITRTVQANKGGYARPGVLAFALGLPSYQEKRIDMRSASNISFIDTAQKIYGDTTNQPAAQEYINDLDAYPSFRYVADPTVGYKYKLRQVVNSASGTGNQTPQQVDEDVRAYCGEEDLSIESDPRNNLKPLDELDDVIVGIRATYLRICYDDIIRAAIANGTDAAFLMAEWIVDSGATAEYPDVTDFGCIFVSGDFESQLNCAASRKNAYVTEEQYEGCRNLVPPSGALTVLKYLYIYEAGQEGCEDQQFLDPGYLDLVQNVYSGVQKDEEQMNLDRILTDGADHFWNQ